MKQVDLRSEMELNHQYSTAQFLLKKKPNILRW